MVFPVVPLVIPDCQRFPHELPRCCSHEIDGFSGAAAGIDLAAGLMIIRDLGAGKPFALLLDVLLVDRF